jgi:oligoribonuclease
MADYIVWVDCEMTGLDVKIDELCEIAVVITDEELNEVDEGLQIVIKPSEAALTNMGEFVTQMHTESGLLAELSSGVSVAEAEAKVLSYLSAHLAEKQAPLAGNSIGTDRLSDGSRSDWASGRCAELRGLSVLLVPAGSRNLGSCASALCRRRRDW